MGGQTYLGLRSTLCLELLDSPRLEKSGQVSKGLLPPDTNLIDSKVLVCLELLGQKPIPFCHPNWSYFQQQNLQNILIYLQI